jgi:D-lactate dehydrogenase (cytochrome)
MHSGDMGFHKRSPPEVVVFPQSAEEVQAVVKAAYDARVPVVPRGAGSGLEGGAIPYQGGVVLDLMRMKSFKCVRKKTPTA